jgi:2,3-dihydroxy-p-cumate/2,3-dihydroxybenzoate 3,4-dioxygenase
MPAPLPNIGPHLRNQPWTVEMQPTFRYRKLGYIALGVTNLERSVTFYRDVVGLELIGVEEGKMAFLRCDADHHNIVLYASASPSVRRFCFQMESPVDLDKAEQSLAALGVELTEVDSTETRLLQQGRTVRFRVPGSQLPIELYCEMQSPPAAFVPTVADIVGLGHIVLEINVKEWQSTVAWMLANANFRLSDQVDGYVSFLRCFPNPVHHSLGIGRAPRTHLHHFNFMVRSIDDIGRAVNRLRKAGAPIVFGPGRHVASTSIFLYFLDPDGMTVEFSFGMEHFDEQTPRDSRVLAPKMETVDAWGGVPAPGYAAVGDIEGALA